jgi:signal transduction histidine kinase
MLQFKVADTGIGIGKKELQQLFQAFYQVDGSSTRQHGGTGLGLYLTKSFTEMLGGEITVKSKQGKGSIFSVILPLENEISLSGYTSESLLGPLLLKPKPNGV